MKTKFLFALACATLIAGCKKDDDAPAPATGPALQIIGDPFFGIFMWEVDANTDGYLQADNAGGYVFRGTVPNDYSLANLATDDNCRLELTSNYAPDGTLTYGIHMPGTEDWWMPIMNSGELMLSQEDLGTENLPDAGTTWRWRRRHSPASPSPANCAGCCGR